MEIKLSDIYRATLPSRSGNEGWIGLEPSGKKYHVIVPVDAQIARGVMACNAPTDGTPFGGYTGWLYFRCEPFAASDEEFDEELRWPTARQNATKLVKFAAGYGIAVTITEDVAQRDAAEEPQQRTFQGRKKGRFREVGLESKKGDGSLPIKCTGCSATWENITRLLTDPSITFSKYKANTTDFRKGHFVFRHSCGGVVEVEATKLGRSRYAGKSLAGSHACPGFCYYEASLSECSAVCEGSVFRRIAGKLKTRRARTG